MMKDGLNGLWVNRKGNNYYAIAIAWFDMLRQSTRGSFKKNRIKTFKEKCAFVFKSVKNYYFKDI